jgi:hypothetical protein
MRNDVAVTRWAALFADLEAQAAAQEISERGAQVDERARHEIGNLTLGSRLRAAIGEQVAVRLTGGLSITGRIVEAGPDWTLLQEQQPREAVIANAHIIGLRGVPRHADMSMGVVESRLRIRNVLRAIARDRSAVRIHLASNGALDATLDRVGADFLEVAAHPVGEPRRRGDVRGVELVPLAAVVAVRRAD